MIHLRLQSKATIDRIDRSKTSYLSVVATSISNNNNNGKTINIGTFPNLSIALDAEESIKVAESLLEGLDAKVIKNIEHIREIVRQLDYGEFVSSHTLHLTLKNLI